jgi:hypothetical protein
MARLQAMQGDFAIVLDPAWELARDDGLTGDANF